MRRFGPRLAAVTGMLVWTVVASAGPAPFGGLSVANAVDVMFVDVIGPAGSGMFGSFVLVLENGNFVVADPLFDSATAVDAGAVHLYNGLTNQRISTLSGSSTGDMSGVSVVPVGDSNFVVRSSKWDGAAVDAGAVTWVNGTTGLNAVVSAANSMVATKTDDLLNAFVLPVGNGNFVLEAAKWDNGAIVDAGALTFGNGNVPLVGTIGAANSAVGSVANDGANLGVRSIEANGNYLILAPMVDFGGVVDRGAVRLASGTTGAVGPFSAANSLVGTTAGDMVGSNAAVLDGGGYVVSSPGWDGPVVDAGATTWSPPAGRTGPVTVMNSLHGTKTGDLQGGTIVNLHNGNYVVTSPFWDNGMTANVGAVTWASGTAGLTGPVTTLNSLHGTTANDVIGFGFTTALQNGNYVVRSPEWDRGAVVDAGAATWGNGNGGTVGPVTAANSLVGTTPADSVSSLLILDLANSNYIVFSPDWDNGPIVDAGALTWGSGNGGTVGPLSAANSFIGGTANDHIGGGGVSISFLPNGNAIVPNKTFDNGGVVDAGAVTWINGNGGTAGVVSAANSIVGSSTGDSVSDAAGLSNGNYVVFAPSWDNGAIANVGAVRLVNGATGGSGFLTPGNSIIGTTANDGVGLGARALKDGNYVITAPGWNNGAVVDAGAVSWRSGTVAAIGAIAPGNSLIGTKAMDAVGSGSLLGLDDGSFLAFSPAYDNGAATNTGAVTFGPTGGLVGPITPQNSVLGTAINGGPTITFTFPPLPTLAGGIPVLRPADNIVTLVFPPPKPNFTSLAPARLADTRPGGATVDGVAAGGGLLATGTTMELTVAGRGGVASDAVAAALNVTAVDGLVGGFVTVFPCGSPRPLASNLNFPTGTVVPNAVLAKIGTGGKVCIFVSQATHIVVDVTGFFPITSTFVSTNPARLLDTRPGEPTVDGLQQGIGITTSASVVEVQVSGRSGVPANATSVALNVTVTEPTGTGFATVFPCGSTRPTASNLNFVPGLTVANLVVSKLGVGGKVCVFTQVGTHLVVDVNGYFPVVTTYQAINPARLWDSRPGSPTIDGQFSGTGFLSAGITTAIVVTGRGGVPANAASVVLNVTVTEPGVAGFVTVFPCGISPPLASNLNFVPGQTVPNAVLVQVGTGGAVCVFNHQPTHLVIDVSGFFPAT